MIVWIDRDGEVNWHDSEKSLDHWVIFCDGCGMEAEVTDKVWMILE